jgi:S-DNA-T family DNA segregation ATPase FtsK/SpoIIIE
VKAALATLTTQGRAVGFCVVAALQDPRKEVMSIRNLFPDRIAMRLDEPEQVDMVLGDGARDRGAAADKISTDPATGAGVAFVRLETDPDPVPRPRGLGLRRRHPRHDKRVRPGGVTRPSASAGG